MRITAKVNVASLLLEKIISSKLLRLKVFAVRNDLSVVPPSDTILEVLQLHRLGLGKVLSVRRNIHSVEPCFRCRLCVIEEQQIGGNGSIGAEHRAGQSDNGVQIKLANELFLDVYLRIVQTEQETIRHDNSSSAVFLQTVQDNRHKQIGSL
ncbi:unknown [Clostridium sp. CAG:138]|nr:unknown [Clostridium sp. CAG:138]